MPREFIAPRRDPSSQAPLSCAQQRFWFLHYLDLTSGHCNVPYALSLKGELRPDILAQSLREVVRRHESLRTCFPLHNLEPAQIILQATEIDFAIEDLSSLEFSEREQAAKAILREESIRPFDVSMQPGVRFRLLRFSERLHWLLLVAHHMVFDTWSLGIFNREMTALYEAYSEGRPSPLPDLEIQYADFACWEKKALDEARFANQSSYWKTRLEGAPELLRLPLDRPRLPFNGSRGKSEQFSLGESMADAMAALSNKESASVFMILLSALTILLHRYGCGRDIVIGSAVANRRLRDTEALIGCFMNTLIFRTQISGDPTFRQLLRQVREQALEAYEHADLPFDQVIASLNPKRNPSYSPYSQVMLIVQNAELPSSTGSSIETMRLPVSEQFVSLQDLILHVRIMDKSLRGRLDYNADLFDRSTIRRMLGHFDQLLTSALKNLDLRISQMNLMSSSETAQLRLERNLPVDMPPGTALLHQLIERQAESSPDKVSITRGDEHVTYGDLNRRADGIARRLIEAGAKPEQRVAVCIEGSIEMAIALLAVLKSGAACVPLATSIPKAHLRALLKKTNPFALITDRQTITKFDSGDRVTILADSESCQPWDHRINDAGPHQKADNLACILFSSASTGIRLPVMVTHRGLVNSVTSLLSTTGFCREVLAVPSDISDGSGINSLLFIAAGARIALLSGEDNIDQAGATAIQATPLVLREMLDRGWTSPPGFKVLCGGESLPGDVAARLIELGAMVWNLYGSTETTSWSLMGQQEPGKPVTIGYPASNTRAYVLDEYLQSSPEGVPGELYIGGTCLARGYLDRPDITAERFVPDAYSTWPGCRLYRTGDIVRTLPEGKLDFKFNSAHQAVIKGLRLKLGEIEAELCNHDAISQAAVVRHRAATGRKEIIAFVVVRRAVATNRFDSSLSIDELKEFLGRQLPSYKIPSAVITVKSLPRTLNGKVDRRALPLTGEAIGVQREWRLKAPGSETEQMVAEMWKRVLQIEQVGVEDNFFDLGGDSLKAQRILAQIERELGISIPVRIAFANPTVARLSLHIDRARRVGMIVPTD